MSKHETWKSWEGRVADGKFPLRQFLGGSEHSAVFLTELPGPGAEKAALKLIDPQLIDPKIADVDRELSRLRATASLSHPHLIRTIETGRWLLSGRPILYVVMEKADEDLAQILPQRALEPAEVGELLPPVIDALSYLHGRGFVHGRITPSNVLAVGDQLKLSTDNVHSAAQTNSARRRLDAYDAPETAAGISLPEGDIWSVGAMLVAALTQNVALVEDGSQRETGLPQNIPEPFRGIARECLRLDPKQRCSLAQIQARLQPSGRSVPVETQSAPISAPPGRRPVFGIALALIVVLAIVFAIYYSRGKSAPDQTTDQKSQPTIETAPASTPPVSQAAEPARVEPPKKTPSSAGEVLRQVLPDIPKSAQNTIRGTIKVEVKVQVDSSGKVTSAAFKSAGSSRYFAGLAMKAAQRWEFSPPMVDGQPTPSKWLLQFRFKKTSTQASPQRVKG